MSTLPNIFKGARKRDDKDRTYGPQDNAIRPSLLESTDKDLSTLPNILKGARKRDDKYKNFIISENDKISILDKLEKDLLTPIKHEKYLEGSLEN